MKTRTIRQWGVAALCLGSLPIAAQAQTLEDASDSDALELNPLVVTATLAPRTADETLSSVTVIDEATLRRQDPTSLNELFRGQPGVDVNTNGSYGKSSSVYIRGTSNNQSVLLIDGIRLRSATTGGASWQYLDPRMFQRAEIVRGSKGSLYGADAMGGVVQLFTREAEAGAPQPYISAGAGSFDTQRYSAGLAGSSGGTRYSFAGSRFTTDGTPVRRDGEDKSYDNTTGLVRLSHTFDGGAELGMLGLRSRGNNQFDGGETDFVQQVAGVYGAVSVTEAWRSRLILSESRDQTDNFYEDSDSTFDTRTKTARWVNTIEFGHHQLIAGAEYSEDKVAGSTDYAVKSRDNLALFGQVLMNFSPVTVQTSLRHDDNEGFGEELTGSLALGFDIDRYHILRASYGMAFRSPTFNELYYPDVGYYSGNPDLEAETSETVEVGARGQYSSWFWDVAMYQTDIDNLIAGQDLRTNIPTSRIQGVELSGGAEIDDWSLAAALTYTDPENQLTGNQLQNRASQSLRFDVDRVWGDWSLGGSWIAQNHRYDDADNEDRLPGFGLVNLRAGWQFAPLWTARLTLENAFDKEYATSRFLNGDDYLNAGRAAFVSVSYGAQ